jgi:hypothetical protein
MRICLLNELKRSYSSRGIFFYLFINSMPHYMVILHALHSLIFCFTITNLNGNKQTVVEIFYNFGNNIYLSTFIVKRHCKSEKKYRVIEKGGRDLKPL